MRQRSWFLGAAALCAVACGGGTDPDPNTNKDMATPVGNTDMADPPPVGEMGPPPDMADNKPILTVVANLQPPPLGPCTGMANFKGKGTVTADVGGINCGAACVGTYTKGQQVTLTAAADATTSKFSGWSGDVPAECIPAIGELPPTTCKVTVNGTTKVTALFERDYFASVQLTDPFNSASSITVWGAANMMNKLAEIVPNPNGMSSTTCLDLPKDATFYVGVKVDPARGLFGDVSCKLPAVCSRTVASGGQLIFFRIM